MQNKKVIFGLIVIIVIMGLALLFTNIKNFSTRNTIKIISSVPMRGATVGQSMYNGTDMAFEEIGYQIGKFKIEFIPKDDGDETGKWQTYLERNIATEAVNDPDVMVYMGTYNSGAAKISIPITNRAGLVQVSAANTWPGLTLPGYLPGEPGIFYPTNKRTFFRVCPNDAVQGPVGAMWAKEMGVKKVYIVDDGDAYGKGIATLFEKKAREIGITVVAHTSISAIDALSIDETVFDIKKQNPDLIYFGGVTANGAIPFVTRVRKNNIPSKIMGPDGIGDESFINNVGKDAEGIFITSGGLAADAMTGKGKDFVDAYKAKYGKDPDIYGIYTYEAGKVVIEAIKKAGVKDRAKILEEISRTENFTGFFGTWSFDTYGDTTKAFMVANIIQNGKVEFIKILQN
jgi:branched-chain amino acid transport system substrate-binding protein